MITAVCFSTHNDVGIVMAQDRSSARRNELPSGRAHARDSAASKPPRILAGAAWAPAVIAQLTDPSRQQPDEAPQVPVRR
jgi:hypothetical protein